MRATRSEVFMDVFINLPKFNLPNSREKIPV